MTTNLHRIYIQTLLARRVMSQNVALQLYGRAVEICQKVHEDFEPPHPVTNQGLTEFLGDITTLLEEVRMSVVIGKEETGAGKAWVALVNTDASDIALSATDYSPVELSYIKAAIDNIITSYPVNSIGSTRALALVSELKSAFSKSQAELVLSSAVSRGWFKRSKRGRYSLAPRSLMELEIYLKEQYEDFIYTCHRCSKVVLTGIKCEHGRCDAHIHESCYNTYKQHRGAKCPKCGKSFDDEPASHLGEKAASREADHFRSGPGKKRKRASRAQGGDEDESEEEEVDEMEDEEGMRQSQSQSQRQDQSQSQSQSQSQEQSQRPPPAAARKGPTWAASGRSNSRRSTVPETQYEEEEDELESSQSARRRR